MQCSRLPNSVNPTDIFSAYWKFAAERQRIYFKRVRQQAEPWTSNSILQIFKFTNVYRASDRTSQFLIKNVIYDEPHLEEDIITRILLFKLFNKIQTWLTIEHQIGPISYSTFNENKISRVLRDQLNKGVRIYSPAYILPPVPQISPSPRKHDTHLALIRAMLNDGFVWRVQETRSLKDLYEMIRCYPMFGPFLAFQMAIDIAYSDLVPLTEDGFVVPGPGALRGIRKCFSSTGGVPAADLILRLTENQERFFDEFGVTFTDLWGRELKPIDIQNLFCEFDKYCRVAFPNFAIASEPKRIKQRFRVTGSLSKPWFPPKWGLNDAIERDLITTTTPTIELEQLIYQ